MGVWLRGLAGVVAALAMGAASAAGDDGRALLRGCGAAVAVFGGEAAPAAADPAGFARCTALVEAFTLSASASQRLSQAPLFCPPAFGLPNGQAVAVVYLYLRRSPDRLGLPGSVLALEALRLAYPCAQ